jgi:hypothetical protein
MRENQLESSNIVSTQSLRPALEREESSAALAPRDGFSPVLAQGGHEAASHARELNRITRGAPSRASRSLLQMQRTHGNRYVQRVLEIARQGEGEGEVSPEVEASIERSRGGGESLEKGTRSKMESAFGVDFSGVRIHTGAESHSLNRAVSAVAFTTGSDIFFRDGAYAPGSGTGKELLAHELTHVVQQGSAPAKPGQAQMVRVQPTCAACEEERSLKPKLEVSQPHDPQELEAETTARTVVDSLDSSRSHEHQVSPSNASHDPHLSALHQGLALARETNNGDATGVIERSIVAFSAGLHKTALQASIDVHQAGGCSCGGRCPKCAAAAQQSISRSTERHMEISRSILARDPAPAGRTKLQCINNALSSAGIPWAVIAILGGVCSVIGGIAGLGGGPAAPATVPTAAAAAAAICIAGVTGLTVGFVTGVIIDCCRDPNKDWVFAQNDAQPGSDTGGSTDQGGAQESTA